MTSRNIRVLVWSELTEPKTVYPNGISGELAAYLNTVPGVIAKTSELSSPECGLANEVLDSTDVLVWWGHAKHDLVSDASVERVVKRVREYGMGFIPLHSSHFSKPFKTLMGTKCALGSWREDGKSENVHVLDRSHPIAQGVKDFVLPQEEMYGEPFDVPKPESLVFISVFHTDGAIFRSGMTWTAGKGKIFYFRPGHESYPSFRDANVRIIIKNAVLWTASRRA